MKPSDAERQKFAADLEAQYRRDWDYYAGAGSVAYGDDTVEALGLPGTYSRSSIGRTPSESSA